ncbi:MAG: universal stress protein, partial [Pseudomonadota bacterium]
MRAESQTEIEDPTALPSYDSILLAVDSSDHANRGIVEAVDLALHYGSKLTAAHVYAAKLHDTRFRQMEGGLPEQFREEQELERQRDVHDDLISKGLSIITDSYLDQVDSVGEKLARPIEHRSLEGKNYRELVNETNNGSYDLLVIGALGLGAVKSSRLGTVCQRVVRRSRIDTLVIKEPTGPISEGPIVVGVDGSSKSFGGLLTALSLAKAWDVPLKVVSAFDPYYHYVAFNRIAGVLSEEAGQVFKFQEQEKLHEEIIDSGLAKIYQGHLSVAQSIASDHAMEIETVLLDGKPHDVIARYLSEVKPSLFVMGTTGIHADPELDIGGNTEYLLSDAQCAVLLSQREHSPQVDRLAAVTTSWTNEAEARMQRVPSFVRSMARMAILRYAQEQGHTVITEGIVEEATAQLMPGHAEQAMEEIVGAYDRGELKRKPSAEDVIHPKGTSYGARWSEVATQLLLTIKDLSLRGNLSMRAEKKARAAGSPTVEESHIRPFLDDDIKTESSHLGSKTSIKHEAGNTVGCVERSETHQHTWQAAALARLMRVPEGFMRDSSKQRIEAYAQAHGHTEVSLDVAEAGLAEARKAMAAQMHPADAALVDPSTSAAQMHPADAAL